MGRRKDAIPHPALDGGYQTAGKSHLAKYLVKKGHYTGFPIGPRHPDQVEIPRWMPLHRRCQQTQSFGTVLNANQGALWVGLRPWCQVIFDHHHANSGPQCLFNPGMAVYSTTADRDPQGTRLCLPMIGAYRIDRKIQRASGVEDFQFPE